jgi:hypothetical protein
MNRALAPYRPPTTTQVTRYVGRNGRVYRTAVHHHHPAPELSPLDALRLALAFSILGAVFGVGKDGK